jgi:hypothetical protein
MRISIYMKSGLIINMIYKNKRNAVPKIFNITLIKML